MRPLTAERLMSLRTLEPERRSPHPSTFRSNAPRAASEWTSEQSRARPFPRAAALSSRLIAGFWGTPKPTTVSRKPPGDPGVAKLWNWLTFPRLDRQEIPDVR